MERKMEQFNKKRNLNPAKSPSIGAASLLVLVGVNRDITSTCAAVLAANGA